MLKKSPQKLSRSMTISFPGLVQIHEFHFQSCEIQFQTIVNGIQCFEIEYHTVELTVEVLFSEKEPPLLGM